MRCQTPCKPFNHCMHFLAFRKSFANTHWVSFDKLFFIFILASKADILMRKVHGPPHILGSRIACLPASEICNTPVRFDLRPNEHGEMQSRCKRKNILALEQFWKILFLPHSLRLLYSLKVDLKSFEVRSSEVTVMLSCFSTSRNCNKNVNSDTWRFRNFVLSFHETPKIIYLGMFEIYVLSCVSYRNQIHVQ